MTFEQWMKKQGIKRGELTAHQLGVLRATFRWSQEGGLLNLTAQQKRARQAHTARALAASRIKTDSADFEIVSSPDALHIEAAADSGDETALPHFEILAYTGVPINLMRWLYPVVIDLAGMRIPKRPSPVLKEHARDQVIGHSETIEVTKKGLEVSGVVSGVGPAAHEVLATAKNGFPWAASVGARADKMIFVEEGKTESANGRQFKGPIYIARKSTLGEISIVAVAADDATKAKVAASAGNNDSRGSNRRNEMKFEQWLKAQGFELEDLSEDQQATLKAAYDAELAASASVSNEPPKKKQATGAAGNSVNDPIVQTEDEIRADATKVERERRNLIEAACKGFTGENVDELKAKALAGEMEVCDFQGKLVDILREQRPKAPAIQAGSTAAETPKVLEAAACLHGGIREPEKLFDAKTLEAADRHYRAIGLQELLLEGAWANGFTGRSFSRDPRGVMEAAFSSMSLPGILAGISNVFLLAGFMAVEDEWRQIAATRSVTDFKSVASYRLTGGMEYEEVGPGGELKHAEVGELEYANQAKTYGRMFGITRTDLINDDLGALTAVPKMIGRGAALKLNKVFWTAFLNNAAFFKTANKNYATGATTALSIVSLTAAELLFLDQVDPDGNPMGVAARKLTVPPALKVEAQQLMSSLKLTEGGGSSKSKVPTDNPHAGKFSVVCSTYLSNANLAGNSAKAWYLLADPADMPVIEIAFLNGQQNPTVESADADFNVLGVQFRGYHDFGVAKQEYRGGVKMKGEA